MLEDAICNGMRRKRTELIADNKTVDVASTVLVVDTKQSMRAHRRRSPVVGPEPQMEVQI